MMRFSPLFFVKSICVSLLWVAGCAGPAAETPAPPNIVLVITDDQGYGDFGFTGNPILQTPHLDALASESIQVNPFYVSPVCAPTRASLMTGRYNYRTRVVDTWVGRAMMEPDEITVAELLRDAGYATGIFGKWHLGDNYPMRPQDQGFEETLVHRGGGIGQPSDPPGAEDAYTNPILLRNGELEQMTGYCTDIYFDEARRWMEQEQAEGRPFFAYIAANAPHSPYHDVPEDLYAHYLAEDLDPAGFPQEAGHPLPEENDPDRLARIFAMIDNIDDNVGRLTAWLDEAGLAENTLVLFLVDNGPNTRRYVAGMEGMKGEVYEGGIRSPLLVRWPARLAAGRLDNHISAHIDLMPTLLDAAGVGLPEDRAIDGESLLPALLGEPADQGDRMLVLQSHRGNAPARYHHVSVRTPRWKLVNNSGFGLEALPEGDPAFELYDMLADPHALADLAAERPEVVADLKTRYDAWFDDVSSTRPDNYAPPRIHIGAPHENPTVLTRQDWRMIQGGWRRNAQGFWLLDVRGEGLYDVLVRFDPADEPLTVRLQAGGQAGDEAYSVEAAPDEGVVRLEGVALPPGPIRLEVSLEEPALVRGPHQVEITHRAP